MSKFYQLKKLVKITEENNHKNKCKNEFKINSNSNNQSWKIFSRSNDANLSKSNVNSIKNNMRSIEMKGRQKMLGLQFKQRRMSNYLANSSAFDQFRKLRIKNKRIMKNHPLQKLSLIQKHKSDTSLKNEIFDFDATQYFKLSNYLKNGTRSNLNLSQNWDQKKYDKNCYINRKKYYSYLYGKNDRSLHF